MPTKLRNHFYHHGRFYAAALVGAATYAVTASFGYPVRPLAAGDAFFAVYLVLAAVMIFRLGVNDLRKRAALEDEGAAIVVLFALAIIVFSMVAIFTVLNQKGLQTVPLVLAFASAPLGWFTLHTISTFHYANLYYACTDGAQTAQGANGLEFPHTPEPGVWEFLYYSFTIGMTAQTSDVAVRDTRMRRTTLFHSVVSFFYNTAIIAMAINAVVQISS